ncbi:MAG: hypothetical protein PHY92_01665 [Alphaproteobacteria bacterium]|nr:hypothetical protein [Alphaproteobacteria bacterium]
MAEMRRELRKPTFRKGLLSVFLFVFVFALFAGSPRLVRALGDEYCCGADVPVLTDIDQTQKVSWIQEVKNWLTQFELLNQIIGIFKFINTQINDFIKLIHDQLGLATAVEHASSSMKVLQKYYADQSKSITKIETPKNALMAEEAAKQAPSTTAATASNVLCNTIVAQQGQIVMYWFALAVQVALSQGTKSIGLGKYADFNGPQFIGFIDKLRCPDTDDPDDPRRGDPLVVNPFSVPELECEAADPDFVDADLSPAGPDFVLEMPPMYKIKGPDGKEISVPIPDDSAPYENYKAQQMFMAKWKYCIITRGSFQTPPVGKSRETPEGKTRAVRDEGLAAVRDAFTDLCFKVLARHTRPNCANTDYNEICAASMAACSAAKANGIFLPFDCDQALTLHQTEYIADQMRRAELAKGGSFIGARGAQGGKTGYPENAGPIGQYQYSADPGDGPLPGERELLLQAAKIFIGTPYSQYDCSHSVWKVYQNAGLPYSYSDTRTFAGNPSFKPIPWGDIQPGDVMLIYRGPDEYGHLQIYAGNDQVYSVGDSRVGRPGHYYRLQPLSTAEGPQAYRYIAKH